MYSINVLLVTFNQEKLVGRAIESVMVQKDYGLNKLVILDDCSTDNNWDVIQNYQKKFPDNIVCYRNEENIGGKSLYENIWKLYTLRGEADMYCLLAGDDVFCDGWFQAAQSLIFEKKIDVCNKATAIWGDFKIVFPNGKIIVDGHAKLVEGGLDLMRMRMRGIISAACCLMSKTLLVRFKKPIMDEGLCLAEEMFDNNKYYYCEKAYYCNWVGFQYHAGIGVSKSIAARDDYYCSLIHANERCKQLYKLCKKDQYWKDYQSYRLKYIMCPTFNMYIKMCVSYGKAFEWSYNRITIKTDMAWFLKDSIKPIIKRFLGIKRCAEETNAINV